MYRSPLLNKAIIPVLALGSLAYAVYATGVMRPQHISVPPLAEPPSRPFLHTVSAVGLIEPASELIAVAPRVPGWIVKVHVSAGNRVHAGDPLFSLDDTDLRAELLLRHEAERVAMSKLERLRSLPRPEDVTIAKALVDESLARFEDARFKHTIVESMADRKAVSAEERHQRLQAVAQASADLAARQGDLDKLVAGAWKQDIIVAESELALARASIARTQADIERLTTFAPINALVLRLTARAGQYAPVGTLDEPLASLGSPGPLHVRADINEHDMPRVHAGAAALAMVRGNAGKKLELEFVRVEPLVIPKKALSGFAQERVDTRVMQVIFKISTSLPNVLVGQQVDVFIDAGM